MNFAGNEHTNKTENSLSVRQASFGQLDLICDLHII